MHHLQEAAKAALTLLEKLQREVQMKPEELTIIHRLRKLVEEPSIYPRNYKLLKDSTIEERSWEDNGENGSYYNTCHHCGRQFTGYKRRVTCKVCASPELWIHKKTGGVYVILFEGVMENSGLKTVGYQAIEGGVIWIRPRDEFYDGRFEQQK